MAHLLQCGYRFPKYNHVLRFFTGKKEEYSSMEEVPFLQKQCERLLLGKWDIEGT